MEGDVEKSPFSRGRIARARPVRRPGGPGEGETDHSSCNRRIKRLEEELQSLKDAYSKKIARTLMGAEQMQNEKDNERDKWYKQKELELERVKAATRVMHALFEMKNKKLKAQLEAQRQEMERQAAEHKEAMRQLREAHAIELEQCAAELEQTKATYKKTIEWHVGVQDALKEEVEELRTKLRQSEEEISHRDEEIAQQKEVIHDLQRKLEANGGSREDEIARWEGRIRALEEELKRVKKVLTHRRLVEGEKLRKELMEYVKFIVHILPDNWKAYATQGGLDDELFPLSPELKQQLQEACAEQSRDDSSPKAYKLTQGPGINHVHAPHPPDGPSWKPLPPLSARRGEAGAIMVTSGSNWRSGSPGAPRSPHLKPSPYSPPPPALARQPSTRRTAR